MTSNQKHLCIPMKENPDRTKCFPFVLGLRRDPSLRRQPGLVLLRCSDPAHQSADDFSRVAPGQTRGSQGLHAGTCGESGGKHAPRHRGPAQFGRGRPHSANAPMEDARAGYH